MSDTKLPTITGKPKAEKINGRPRKELDFEVLLRLIRMHCTKEEIAGWFDVSEDTVERRVNEEFKESFAAVYKKHQGHGKCSLRRWQWGAARKGSIPMLIFLGKQYLGQKDQIDIPVSDDKAREVIISFQDEPFDSKVPNEDTATKEN